MAKRIELNKVTHSVRASQAVLQYGVGAMVDFPEQTLVTAAPETWIDPIRIYDDRFAKALGVEYFGLPRNISYSRFPKWYFCPRCKRFQPLEKWITEYRKTLKPNLLEKDEYKYMTKKLICTKCRQDLVPARIVTVCQNGHLNDFPWIEWVHAKSGKQICSYPELNIKTSASASEGLDGTVIRCSCGASATLSGAFDKDCFKKLDENFEPKIFKCAGNHPFRNSKELCGCYPKTVQRGASSVYFPLVYSSLVIPPYADKLYKNIEKSREYENCLNYINRYGKRRSKSEVTEEIKKNIHDWASDIAYEIGSDESEVEKILIQKWLTPDNQETDVNSSKYRAEEYEALTGEVGSQESRLGDFSREETNIKDYELPYIKSISLIDKVRVVNALVGFSRITPVVNRKDSGFINVKNYNTNWYPAYEVRGEGIFIEINQQDIENWINNNPEVIERAKHVQENYANTLTGKSNPREISAKFLMLHTLSHLLISQLSFECGYSVASLSERIYCSNKEDNKEMSGIFIYTANGDSEGTLGGLVRQGRPDAFPRIFKKAIFNAQTCSNDPVCIMSRGQGQDSLNLAACHACALLPETCCEERNRFLDRGLIVGTYDNPQIGFWSSLEK